MTTILETRWGKPSAVHDPHMLARFAPRPTDVLTTTAPKAGTTWMQQILHQLRSGGDEEFGSIFDVVPWIEWPHPTRSREDTLAWFEELPGPRVFKTHCTFEQTPGVDVVKLVMTSRDPRDCCVSFYHHRMDLSDWVLDRFRFERPDSFESFFET